MAKKKEEVKEPKKVEKKVEKKTPKEEKVSVLLMVAESRMDAGLVAGALNSKGLYLQFIKGLNNPNEELKLTRKEFDKIIEDFKNGEL